MALSGHRAGGPGTSALTQSGHGEPFQNPHWNRYDDVFLSLRAAMRRRDFLGFPNDARVENEFVAIAQQPATQ
jgi:hypothetical protein